MSYCPITKQYYPATEMVIRNTPAGEKVLVHKDVKVYTCDDCGLEYVLMPYNYVDYFMNNDMVLCTECRENYFRCENCGEFHSIELETVIDGECYCQYCRDELFFICEDCGKYRSLNDLTIINDRNICDVCKSDNYTMCDCCDRWFENEHISTTQDGYNVCDYCYDNTCECENCASVYYREENMYYDEDNGCYLCEDCYNSQQKTIKNYNYKPAPRFKRTAEDGDNQIEYFGFEIEVEGDRDYAGIFLDEYGDYDGNDLYLKKDGSVDGFEIVTHPMTRNWFYEVFVPKMTRGMNYLRKQGFRGHNRAGIHIHVSTNAITGTMLNKMINLLFQKNTHNKKLWLAITQRKKSEMKRWCSIDPEDIYDKKIITERIKENEKKGYCKPALGSERYLAINTFNYNTIEFRMFNSNTRPERIIKNAQVIFSLIDFTKTKTRVSMKNYLKFIEDHRKDYKELYDFLIEKHIYIPELSLERLKELPVEDNNEIQKYIQSLSATQNLEVDNNDNEGDIQCA